MHLNAIELNTKNLCHNTGNAQECLSLIYRYLQLGYLCPVVSTFVLAFLEVASALPPLTKSQKALWCTSTTHQMNHTTQKAAATRLDITGGRIGINGLCRHEHNQNTVKEDRNGPVAVGESKSDWHTTDTRVSEYGEGRVIPEV